MKEEKHGPNPNASAYEHASDQARFNRPEGEERKNKLEHAAKKANKGNKGKK